MKQRVILCEGPDDLDFLAGYFETRRTLKAKAADPWGRRLPTHHYTYTTSTGAFVKAYHCGGTRAQFRKMVDLLVQEHQTHPLESLTIVLDDDGESAEMEVARAIVSGLQAGFGAQLLGVDWHRVVLGSGDAATPGLPTKQTLERLVCAAMARVDPGRPPSVDAFLQSAPRGLASHKNIAMAFAAKWTDCSRRDFYKGIWADASLAAQLETQLGEGLAVLQTLAS